MTDVLITTTETPATTDTPEAIDRPVNKKMFPTALPPTGASMDITLIPNRIFGPIETNDMVREAVETAAKKRTAEEPFIDRRDPVTLRRTLENIHNGAAVMRNQTSVVATKVVEVTKAIDALKKLDKQWGKQKSNTFAREAQKQIQERLIAAEEALTKLKQKERSIASDIKRNAQALKDFIDSRPRKGFPTNGEMLQQFAEAEALERELHKIDHLASSKAGMLI